MMEFGKEKALCPICGEETLVNHYRDEDISHVGELRFDNGQYAIFSDNNQVSDGYNTLEELMRQYSIKCNIDGHKVNFFHSCSENGCVFNGYFGYIPSYYILIYGIRGAGKSEFLKAFFGVSNGNITIGDYVLRRNCRSDKMESTAVNDEGSTDYCKIMKEIDGKLVTIAIVYLIDTSGEGNAERFYASGRCSNLINSGVVDGVVFVADASSDKTNEATDELTKVVSNFNALNDINNMPPVAMVFSHMDDYFDKLENQLNNPQNTMVWDVAKTMVGRLSLKTKDEYGDDKNVYIVKNPFKRANSTEVKDLKARFILQQELTSNVNDIMSKRLGRNSAKFLVQSCKLKVDSTDGKQIPDNSEQFNVDDPIIWLLNTIGLLPLK